MTTAIAPRPTFHTAVARLSLESLKGSVSAAELTMAAARVTQAFDAARAGARDPAAYDAVLDTQQGMDSVARAIRQAALSGVLPGGAAPLAWITPQRTRKNDPWEVRYSLSHRGAALLAADEDWAILPVPVHVEDSVTIDFGEITAHTACGRDPTTADDLLGVYLTIRRAGRLISRPWMSAAQVESHRKRSPAGDFGPWKSDYVAMAQKTIIHYAVARGILPLRSSVARDGIVEPVEMEEVAPARARVPTPRQLQEDPPEAATIPERTPAAVKSTTLPEED